MTNKKKKISELVEPKEKAVKKVKAKKTVKVYKKNIATLQKLNKIGEDGKVTKDYSVLPMKELESYMTPKQILFCRYYIVDWNGTKAAIDAGYSKKSAYSIYLVNMKKDIIKAYVDKCMNNLEEIAGESKLKVVKEYQKIAYSSMANYQKNWMTLEEYEDLTDNQKACIKSIEYDSDKAMIKFTLYDKTKALDSLRKLFGYDEPVKQQIDDSRDDEKKQTLRQIEQNTRMLFDKHYRNKNRVKEALKNR